MDASRYVFDATDDSFDRDVVEASRERLVLVDCWAAWCQPCRMLMPVLERVVADLQGRLLLAKVDTDAEQALATRLGIRSLPTVKLFRGGQMVDEFMGAQSEQAVRAFLAPHLPSPTDDVRGAARAAVEHGDAAQALALLRAAHGEHPNDVAVCVDLAAVLLSADEADEAERVLDAADDDPRFDAEIQQLRARSVFARRAAAAAAPDELARRLRGEPADDEARHDLAAVHVAEGRFEEAMDLLLELLRRNRAFRDDAARRDLLAVFAILGADSPLVRDYRRRMASTLH